MRIGTIVLFNLITLCAPKCKQTLHAILSAKNRAKVKNIVYNSGAILN